MTRHYSPLVGVGLIILFFCGVALSDKDILLKGPLASWYINGGAASSQIGSWFLYDVNQYSVCDTSTNYREPTNWLRSDFMDVKDAIRVDIVVNYTMRKCQKSRKYCKEYFKLYGHQTSKTSPSPNPFVASFDLLAQAKPTNLPARMVGPRDFNLLNVSIKTASEGLYLAFFDQGACLSILSVRASFNYCPEKEKNLVSFVRTVSPYSDADAIQVEGKCTDQNSRNTTALAATCMSNGKWKLNDSVRCLCQPGYEYVEKPQPHCRVSPAPTISPLKNKTVTKGDPIHLLCNATGNPAPNVSWSKAGGTIKPSYVSGNVLRIPRAELTDAGKYICTARNEVSVTSVEAFVTVKLRPHSPIPVSTQLTHLSIKVHWREPESHGYPVLMYSVHKVELDQAGQEVTSRTYNVNEDVHHYLVGDINGGKTYKLYVTAWNTHGESVKEHSKSVTVKVQKP